MALKPCEQCKHAIRSEDSRCPHCGLKQPGAASHVGKVALVLFALGFGVWVFDATSSREPEREIASATRASPPAPLKKPEPAPLSALERTLQERCGRQTDDDGNWIVKGAEGRARCRVQVELELEREQREARLAAQSRAVRAAEEPLARHVAQPRAEVPHVASVSRVTKTARPRAVRHEPVQRATTANLAAPAPSAPEPAPPAKEKEKGGFDPGDDLQPLVPAAGALNRDPVPGEPMFVKPDAAFL